MSTIEEQLDAITDAYLAYLDGSAPAPSVDGLPADVRAEAAAHLALLDAMWGGGVSRRPLHDDPVARRFGFDRAGHDIEIDGRKVSALRKAAAIDLKDLTTMVNNGGGDTSTFALLQLEQSDAVAVPQRTASALAAALGVHLRDFEAPSDVDLDAIRTFLDSAAFDELIASWAAGHDREPEPVRRIVADRMLASQFRATDVTPDQLLAIARAILRTLE